MDDLAAFIEARLADDEAIARAAAALQADPENGWGIDGRAITPHIGVIHEVESREHIARHDPARVLREVTAKRAMVAMCREDLAAQYEPGDGEWNEGSIHASKAWANTVLRTMAAIWADHPDYPSPAAL